jgi:signal peptide peptidase SppA
MKNHQAIAKFFNKPLALHHTALDAMLTALQTPEAFFASDYDDSRYRQYGLINGVAIIPIQGVLSKSPDWWCQGTGYDWIREGFDCALQDPDVKAIVFDVNSPGGTVEGCFDLADHIYAARGAKPIWSILCESAYSAAYALASCADRMTVPRTGGAGSIGVVSCHVDLSKMLANAGVKVTYIQYGDRKTDGAAEKPLSEEALACFQSDVDAMGELFVQTVARNRGIGAETIMKTEAACFMGQASVELGLCDEVLAPDAAFSALLEKLG